MENKGVYKFVNVVGFEYNEIKRINALSDKFIDQYKINDENWKDSEPIAKLLKNFFKDNNVKNDHLDLFKKVIKQKLVG